MTTLIGQTRRLAVLGFLLGSLTFAAAEPVAASDAVTDANLAEKVGSAETADDHNALATYFRGQAAAAKEKVRMHEAMLASARKGTGKASASWELHCRTLIQTYKAELKEAEALAVEHEKMARKAK